MRPYSQNATVTAMDNIDSFRDGREQGHRGKQAEIEQLRTALEKIDDIRNSIIGTQNINWSEHIYPLVAALEEAGFEGKSYAENHKNMGTLIERTNRAEAEIKRLRTAGEAALADLADGDDASAYQILKANFSRDGDG